MADIIDNQNPNQPSQAQQQSNRVGTGFTNLQRILQANASNRLGQAIGQRVGGIAGQASSNIAGQQQQFEQQTQKAFSPYVGGQQFATSAIAAPTSVASDPQALARFQAIRQGQYAGPTALANANVLQSQAQQVSDLARLGQSAGGRQALLGTFFGSPTYGTGQRALDALLLQSNPQQAAQLGALKGLASRVSGQLGTAQNIAQQEAQTKAQQAQAMGQAVTGQLTTAQEAQQKALQDQLAQVQQQEINKQAAFNRIQQGIASGQVSADDLAALGMTGLDQGKGYIQLYGQDPTQLLKTQIAQTPTDIASIVSQQQAATSNALAQLAGQGQVFDPTKVGTFQGSTQQFDVDKFKAGIAAGQAKVAALQQQQEQNRQQMQQLTDNLMDLQSSIMSGKATPEQSRQYISTLNRIQGLAGSQDFISKVQQGQVGVSGNAPLLQPALSLPGTGATQYTVMPGEDPVAAAQRIATQFYNPNAGFGAAPQIGGPVSGQGVAPSTLGQVTEPLRGYYGSLNQDLQNQINQILGSRLQIIPSGSALPS